MPHYVKIGNIPKYRHTFDTEIFYEEVIGAASFDGPYSILYHRNEPTVIRKFSNVKKDAILSDGFLETHTHLLTSRAEKEGDFFLGRTYLFGNDHLSVGISRVNKKTNFLFKMGLRDLILFIHEGIGILETTMGNIKFDKYDYLVIPKGIPFRLIPEKNAFIFFIESEENVNFPARYLNQWGQFKLQSPLSNRNIRIPEPEGFSGGITEMVEDNGNVLTKLKLGHDPRDVEGWEGTLYPFAINALDQMPWVGKIHLPPPIHQTFEGRHYMVATFLPRPFDFHERSIPISFYHSNTDVDEVLFYSSGNFMSRRGIEKGSVTIHVRNFTHGPHPGTYRESIGKKSTDEIAVMIETYERLKLYNGIEQLIDRNYPLSWSE